MHSRSFVVTGGNRGIGFAICESLLKQNHHVVFVCARNLSDAEEACKALNCDRAHPAVVDLNSESSMDSFSSSVAAFDVLINNAGHAVHGDAFDERVARETIGPNFFGTRSLTYKLLAKNKIRERIITVTSTAGKFDPFSSSIVSKLRSPSSDEELTELAHEFIDGVRDGSFERKGFPKSCYRVSKALANSWMTQILPKKCNIFVAAVCPGYVATRMSSNRGTKTPAQGAEAPVWLATAPLDTLASGQFFTDVKTEHKL